MVTFKHTELSMTSSSCVSALQVFPEQLDVRANSSATFRVAFRPPLDGQYYSQTLEVVACLKSHRSFRGPAEGAVQPPWTIPVQVRGFGCSNWCCTCHSCVLGLPATKRKGQTVSCCLLVASLLPSVGFLLPSLRPTGSVIAPCAVMMLASQACLPLRVRGRLSAKVCCCTL